jgi:hypothetical protein
MPRHGWLADSSSCPIIFICFARLPTTPTQCDPGLYFGKAWFPGDGIALLTIQSGRRKCGTHRYELGIPTILNGRHGLVRHAEEWPFKGELNPLSWHDP